MAYSYVRYTGDGTTTQYAIAFSLGFLSRDDVHAFVNDVEVPFTWINDGLLELDTAPANGDAVLFRRIVSKEELIHDYHDGAVVIEKNLDESNMQNLMAVHEMLDGFFDLKVNNEVDMLMNRIINLGDPIDDGDAVNYRVLKDRIADNEQYAIRAENAAAAATVSADAAEQSEISAHNSATSAALSKDNAEAFADEAEISKNSAHQSAMNAQTSATSAHNYSILAENAKTEAESAASAANTYQGQAKGYRDEALDAKTAAQTAATEATGAWDEFSNTYHGALAAPPVNNVTKGDLYFNTLTNLLMVYNGTYWVQASGESTMTVAEAVGQDGHTIVYANYTDNKVMVILNGYTLPSSEFSATDGVSVDVQGTQAGDEIQVISFANLMAGDYYTKEEVDVLIPGKNRLINGGFDVWQRGESITNPTGGTTFTADRWLVRGTNDTGGSTTTSKTNDISYGNGLKLTVSGHTDYCYIAQKLENPGVVDLITVDFVKDGDKYTASIPPQDLSSYTFDDASYFGIQINTKTPLPDGEYTYFQVQLEEGGIATAFEYRPLSVEEELCKRYYQVVANGTGGYFSGSSGVAYATSSFPVIMRSDPSNPSIVDLEPPIGTSGIAIKHFSKDNLCTICYLTSAGTYFYHRHYHFDAEL